MSIPGERDEKLERWLRELRPNQGAETKSCLDAETAAAWVTGSLSGDALQQAQTHLADCDRCQTLVGSLVRADVGGMPKAPAPARTWLRWLVPTTAAATIIIAFGVWAVRTQDASAPVSTVVENTVQKETATVQEPPAAPGAEPLKAEEGRARRDAVGRMESEAAKSAPAATAGARPPEPAQQALSDAAVAALLEIVTPDQSARWRIGRQVQRSMDRGASWQAVQIGAPAIVTAGSAPSRTVCWLVGRGGIVLLTTNGTAFNRIPFPEPSDLTAVSALDARSAMVTTADGRTFRTSDGGTTWTR